MLGRLGDGPFRVPTLFFRVGGDPLAGPFNAPTHWPVQSADGRVLALPDGPSVAIYDAPTGVFRRMLLGLEGRASRGSFSTDGKRYACSNDHGAIRIWDVDSGQEEASVELPDEGRLITRISATQFAPGDRQPCRRRSGHRATVNPAAALN